MLTWPITVLLTALIFSMAYMYGRTTDEETKKRIPGYIDKVVTFLIGGVTGGAITGTAVYFTLTG